MKKNKLPLSWLAFAILLMAINGWAAQLIVEGRSELRLEKDETGIVATGSYTISNLGSDKILSAYPVIIGPSLIWTGEPKDLAPGESFVWKVRSTKSETNAAPLSEKELPTQGTVPIYATRLYRDSGAYQFTSIDVLLLPSPELAESQVMKLRSPEISTKVSVTSEGEEFVGKATVRNLTNSRVKIVPSLVVPAELRIQNLPEVFELEPLAEHQIDFLGTNFSATLGSTYPITLLLQWESEGIRKAVSAVTYVKIFMDDHSAQLQLGAIIIGCLGVLGIVLLVRHRRRHVVAH